MARGAILLVDDDEQILRFVSMALERAGFEVAAARGAPRALGLVRERAFDAVVLDHGMPEMSGVEALVEIRKIRPGICAVFSSGRISPELAAEAQRMDARVLEKPYRMATLVDVLDGLFAGRRDPEP